MKRKAEDTSYKKKKNPKTKQTATTTKTSFVTTFRA